MFYEEVTRAPPPWPPSNKAIQHPAEQAQLRVALRGLRGLDVTARAALLKAVSSHVTPLDDWLDRINANGYATMCLGENHNAVLRRFMAERLFPKLTLDTLAIEDGRSQTQELLESASDDDDYGDLLGADIIGVLRAVRGANPSARIVGIEERAEQYKERVNAGIGSRESSIEGNLRHAFRKGERHVILYGAFHCKDGVAWLHRRLLEDPPAAVEVSQVQNARIGWEHLSGSFEILSQFFDELGLATGDYAISSPSTLPKKLHDWFPIMSTNLLNKFDSVIVFRLPKLKAA
jgi:hypothetical protein